MEKHRPIPRVETEPTPSEEYRNISFEPAKHGKDTAENALKLFERFQKDWYNTHTWENPELMIRISAVKPEFLGIDTLSPIVGKNKPIKPEILWTSLPASPKEINNKGVVRVVAGDATSSFIQLVIADKEVGKDLAEKFDNLEVQELLRPFYPAPIPATTWAVGYALLKAADRLEKKEPEHQKKISRRTFLKRAGATLIVGAGASIFPSLARATVASMISTSKNEAYLAKDQQTKEEELEKIDRLKWPFFDERLELEARNYIVLVKTQESMAREKFPIETPASVVFGNAHSLNSTKSLLNRDNARRAITAYFLKIANTLDKVVEGKPILEQEKGRMLEDIYYQFARTEVYKVTEPPEPVDNSPRDIADLHRSVTITAVFQSPFITKIAKEVMSRQQ